MSYISGVVEMNSGRGKGEAFEDTFMDMLDIFLFSLVIHMLN